MTRHVQLRELLIGIEGLALLRHLYDGEDVVAAGRIADIQRLLTDERFAVAETTTEADPRAGYRDWSPSYDHPGNPIVELEQAVMERIIAARPPGPALDAACGTGRHAARLVAHGHQVLGVDITPEMLARARQRVPQARFVEGDLRELPAEEEEFDLVVCGLALAHLADLRSGVAELARVTAAGGRIAISVLHPMLAMLGWQAPFADAAGQRKFVREYPHGHGEYLAAFRECELEVAACEEPHLAEAHLPAKRRAFENVPEATRAAYLDLPAVLVWELVKRPAGSTAQ